MSKDPCAHLRRESRSDRRKAENLDRDNTRAVVEYMLQRGAFASWDLPPNVPADVDWYAGAPVSSSREPRYRIAFQTDVLPGQEWCKKNRRIKALDLCERQTSYVEHKRGGSRYVGDTYVCVETVQIPHWDYDGLDPLIEREPAERVEADLFCDSAAQQRRWVTEQIADQVEIDAGSREIEDCIALFGCYPGCEYRAAA